MWETSQSGVQLHDTSCFLDEGISRNNSEEHCCHHTFPRIAASIQPNPRSIQVSIHPWLISPHDSDQMSQRSQFSADALWQSRDADRIEI